MQNETESEPLTPTTEMRFAPRSAPPLGQIDPETLKAARDLMSRKIQRRIGCELVRVLLGRETPREPEFEIVVIDPASLPQKVKR